MEKIMLTIETSQEAIEDKKERLLPVLRESEDSFYDSVENSERLVRLIVSRKKLDGSEEKIEDLVVVEINDDGPEFCFVNENNEPTASATISWVEIIDVKKGN